MNTIEKHYAKRTKTIGIVATIALVSFFLALTAAPAMAADSWVSDPAIVSGLAVPKIPDPTVFCMDETWYLIFGESYGGFSGWNWTGSTWVSDSAIVSGLGGIGRESSPTVFCMNGTWYLIAGHTGGIGSGRKWTGSTWVSYPAITSGLGGGSHAKPTVFCMDETWYLIYGGQYASGSYKWTGSSWQSDSAIRSGLSLSGGHNVYDPAVFNKDGEWYAIVSSCSGSTGYHWTGSTWEEDSDVISGVPGFWCGRPTVFNKDGVLYLIAGEQWTNVHGYRQNPANIKVSKTVRDPVNGTWVKETTAVSATLRFRCEVTNTGLYNLTNITVVDILSDSLNYSDSATVDGVPQEPVKIGPNEYEWNFTGPLEPKQAITIEFNADVATPGTDTNVQNATAWCEQTGEWPADEDSVSVTVPPPSIDVNKTVWDPVNERWIKEVMAKVSDTMRFKCDITNTGVFNLKNITVVDVLSDSLNYSDSATVDGESREPDWIAGNQSGWNFTEPLAPAETITIEFDVDVIDSGFDCNVQNATAFCEEAVEWVSDEDEACIEVQPNNLYFEPGKSNASYCNVTTMQIYANTTDDFQSGQINITYDANCANITNVEFNPIWTNNTWYSETDGSEWITFRKDLPMVNGTTLIANLTIHCLACDTELHFLSNAEEASVAGHNRYSALFNDSGTDLSTYTGGVGWIDGMFRCLLSDLTVTSIDMNCGYLFANESNELCAKIESIGDVDAGAFSVNFSVDGYSEEVRINGGLAVGANKTVCVNDTTLRNAGAEVDITVTADCNGEVPELDETNNVTVQTETVVNNGYKGKRYTGGEDITTWKTFELNGNLLYSLGDSYYLSSSTYPDWTTYNASWTASDLLVPGTGTVVEARLYVPYTWDKAGVMPTYVSMSFNGISQTLDAHYSDDRVVPNSKPYGMLTYNVIGDFDANGNVANLTNSYPGGDEVSMRGMLLVVVYADESEPKRKIFVNEGFDLLYGGSSKCTTPEEATAYAPFGAIDVSEVETATLITVAPGADGPEGDLSFNDQTWTDVWSFTTDAQIGIDERDVTTHLNATDNEAGIRSSGDWMEASNAILVVEKKTEVAIGCAVTAPGGMVSVPITMLGVMDYGAGTINVEYDSSVVTCEGVSSGPQSTVQSYNIDNTAGIVNISAQNAGGVSGDVIFATVTFKAVGSDGECSPLNLTVDYLSDTHYITLPYYTTNCSICIVDDVPPVMEYPTASPPEILNDNGRARVPGTNVSQLSVIVSDPSEANSTTVNLTPIRGSGFEHVPMNLVSGTVYSGVWSTTTNATTGEDLTHSLVVTATDVFGNSNTALIPLTVLRRGDVVRNNRVDMGDALYIARYTVGLEPAPDEFAAGVVPASSWDGVNMGDALYIARYTVGLENAP